MSINFSTYSQELNDSKNKIMSGQDSDTWVLFSYGQGNDLKLSSSGGNYKQLISDLEDYVTKKKEMDRKRKIKLRS